MIFHTTSKRPVLLVGNGVRSAQADQLIIDFAKKTNIPIVTTMNAVDIIQDDLKIGFIGTYGNRIANAIVSESDLLITVGARLNIRQVGRTKTNFAPKAKLIRVDIDQNELSQTIKEDETKYLMDAKSFMKLLLQEDIPCYSKWLNKCKKAKDVLVGFDLTVGNIVFEKISTMLPKNPFVTVDVGQNQCWCAQSLTLSGNCGRIIIAGGYGSMGCALPFAIGASIANGNQIVYCFTGDGGMQMNIQELEVVQREKLPIKIIVINNQSLGKIREIQELSYHSKFAQTTKHSGYSVPKFERIANAYGIKAISLTSYELLTQYQSWFQDNEPCLIDLEIPEDCLLIPKIEWDSGKIKPNIPEEIHLRLKSILN